MVFSFASSLRYNCATMAELQAIFKGLPFAWDQGFNLIEVESDSKTTLTFIKDPPNCHPTFTIIVRKISYLLELNWTITFNYSYRKANKVVDDLANWAFNTTSDLQMWSSLLIEIFSLSCLMFQGHLHPVSFLSLVRFDCFSFS